jgi:hypothetical protein
MLQSIFNLVNAKACFSMATWQPCEFKTPNFVCNGQWVDTSYGCSKAARNLIPKSPYKWKKNVKNQC